MAMDNIRNRRSDSGQVMVEAVISLCLLAMVWLVATFAAHMNVSRIRSLTASRYASWVKGNGSDASVDVIGSNFFFVAKGSKLVEIENIQPVGMFDAVLGNDRRTEFDDSPGPFRVVVRFGIEKKDVPKATATPFNFMKTQLPLMPPSLVENLLQVESRCQWDNTGDSWQTLKGAMKGLWSQMKSEAISFGDKG